MLACLCFCGLSGPLCHACLLKPTASIAHLRPLRVEGLRGLVLLPESVAEYFVQHDSRWQCAGCIYVLAWPECFVCSRCWWFKKRRCEIYREGGTTAVDY